VVSPVSIALDTDTSLTVFEMSVNEPAALSSLKLAFLP
jgi:hypothetical protein